MKASGKLRSPVRAVFSWAGLQPPGGWELAFLDAGLGAALHRSTGSLAWVGLFSLRPGYSLPAWSAGASSATHGLAEGPYSVFPDSTMVRLGHGTQGLYRELVAGLAWLCIFEELVPVGRYCEAPGRACLVFRTWA